jgi:arylsulfatase A-like enzyme
MELKLGSLQAVKPCVETTHTTEKVRKQTRKYYGDKKMTKQRPNIIFIMTDDHAAHALSCYGSKINKTPNMDRIANEGVLFNNCFCTNSICEPSRAAILTGTYNHINKVTTIGSHTDKRL